MTSTSAVTRLRALPEPAPTTPAVLWFVERVPRRLRAAGLPAGAGHALLLLAGLLVAVCSPFLGLNGQDWRAVGLLASVMLPLTAVSMALPWGRFPGWSTLALPILGLGALAFLGLTTDTMSLAFVGLIPLWFLFLGLFHRVLAGTLMLPLACATYVAMIDVLTPSAVVRLFIYCASWFAISALLSLMLGQQRLISEHLQTVVHTDALTGLGNRRGLELRLDEATPGDCVVLCDLDLFKSINDAFGHAAGDEVLVQFGSLINEHTRRRDYAARYGGEEFVLLLVKTEPAQAFAALDSLRTEWLELGAGVTFSAGIASVRAGQGQAEVLEAADAALYEAKAAGRDRFHLSRQDLPEISRAVLDAG